MDSIAGEVAERQHFDNTTTQWIHRHTLLYGSSSIAGGVAERQQFDNTTTQSSLFPSCYKSTKGYTSGLANRTRQNGYN
mgnify:CR=1 FL=1